MKTLKKIKIAVHHTNHDSEASFSIRWVKRLKKLGIRYVVVDMEDSNIFKKISDCNGIMWHWAHSDPSLVPREKNSANKILDGIESSTNIKIFPNHHSRWHYDEKVSQYFLLKSVCAPIIDTNIFWKKEEALKFLEKAKFPIVFKLSVGAGSSNVLKMDNKNEAKRYVIRMFDNGIVPYTLNEFKIRSFFDVGRICSSFNYLILNRFPAINYFMVQKNYVYFQEYLKNKYDIRITVVGNRAFGFIRYNRSNDFRASGSGNISYDLMKIPVEAVKISFNISKKLGFQSMAYDFLLDNKGKPKIGEISYCYKNTAIHNCPGYWDDCLRWHNGNFWPEDLILDDFLSGFEAK